MTHQETFYYYLILFIILCQKAMYNWMLSAGLFSLLKTDMSQCHRSDSIQGTDYIATPIQRFLGQKMKI